MRSGRTRCSRRHELSRRYRRCPIAASPCRSMSRRHDCATPGHPTDAVRQSRTRPERAAKHIRSRRRLRRTHHHHHRSWCCRRSIRRHRRRRWRPPTRRHRSEARPTRSYSRWTSGPAPKPSFPQQKKGQTGDRERHGTGDEISLTSHIASEHVCRRTAEPIGTQHACQTGHPGIGLFFDSTPSAGCRPVLFRVQGRPSLRTGRRRLRAQGSRLRAQGSGLRAQAQGFDQHSFEPL